MPNIIENHKDQIFGDIANIVLTLLFAAKVDTPGTEIKLKC